MVVLLAVVCELATGLYVDIKQRQRVTRCNCPSNAARFSKDQPRRGPVARKLRDVRCCYVKGGWFVMPVLCRQIDEDLKRMGSGAGTCTFVVKRPARCFEPIQITGPRSRSLPRESRL